MKGAKEQRSRSRAGWLCTQGPVGQPRERDVVQLLDLHLAHQVVEGEAAVEAPGLRALPALGDGRADLVHRHRDRGRLPEHRHGAEAHAQGTQRGQRLRRVQLCETTNDK